MGEDLTEFPHPLIIRVVSFLRLPPGGGGTIEVGPTDPERRSMRTHVYLLEKGGFSVLVEASVGSGKAPVLLQGVTPENVVAEVLPVVNAQKRTPKPAQGELL